MRNMKKLLSMLLALAMIFSLSVTAFADEVTEDPTQPTQPTYKISVPATDSHTYEVYQIFTGDLYDGVLSNIMWGANGTSTGEVSAAVLNTLKNLSGTNEEKLDVILQYVDLSKDAFVTVTGGHEVAVAPGYYLLKDASIGTDDAYTTFIVVVVEDVTIARKAAKPGIDKQVWDEATDDDKEPDENWGETADHELNEVFQFKLIATLSPDEDYADYDTYKLVFHDSMSAGITFDSIKEVTVNGTKIEGYTHTATAGQAGGSWTLTIADLKQHDANLADGCVVEVIYNAHLNNNAVIGNIDENLNDVYLEYSNNPNWEWSYDEDGNPENPGNDGEDNDNDGETDEEDEKEEPTGETEKDTVWVFTYRVNVTKVDGADATKLLPDAEFKMQNAAGKWLIVDEATGKVQSWTTDETQASVLKSDANGVFSVIGLDHGTYYLVETKAPAGYNLLDEPFTVTITAEHQEDTVTSAHTSFGENVKGDIVEVTVTNNAGIVLPETGGMGTTLIYMVGAFMVLCATVLLVTKRRMVA